MIREQGQVIAVKDGWVQVSTQLKSGCHGCQHQNHCGAGLLSKAFPHRDGIIQVFVEQEFQVGDAVELLLSEQTMVRFSLLVYGVPILALALSAMFGQWLWPTQELFVIAFSVLISAGVLFGLRLFLGSKEASIRRSLRVQARIKDAA